MLFGKSGPLDAERGFIGEVSLTCKRRLFQGVLHPFVRRREASTEGGG